MGLQVLSETSVFHALAIETLAAQPVSEEFRAKLEGSMTEVWIGDPHAKSVPAIEAGPTPEGDIPTISLEL